MSRVFSVSDHKILPSFSRIKFMLKPLYSKQSVSLVNCLHLQLNSVSLLCVAWIKVRFLNHCFPPTTVTYPFLASISYHTSTSKLSVILLKLSNFLGYYIVSSKYGWSCFFLSYFVPFTVVVA